MQIPKYEQVKKYVINYIKKHHLKYNDSILTENELMEVLSMSRHTIRRALSDLINQGWLYSMRGSGTFVLDPNADRNAKGKMIGVVTTYFKEYIFPDILSGIDDVVGEEGYSILLGTTKNNIARERTVISNILNNQLAGLIVEPTKSAYPNHNVDLYKQCAKRGIPIIYIHATYRDFDASYIIEDDEYAGYIATKHLLDLGHRQIIGLFKEDDMQGHGRYEGFVRAYKELGIESGQNLIIWFTTEGRKDLFSGHNLEKMLEHEKAVTAFVCYSDQVAIDLIDKLKNLGHLVPNDYSIVSFDNSDLSNKLDVKLTTVAHPKYKLGEKAAKSLLKLIENPQLEIKEKMIPELIIRESTQKR